MAMIQGFGVPLPGSFSNARAGYAEPREAHASVALFDTFEGSATRSTHGEKTEAALMQRGGFTDRDVQRVEVNGGVTMQGLAQARTPEEFAWQLDNYIVQSQADLLRGTSRGLEGVLADPDSEIRTISQSMGQGPSKVTESLFSRATNDPLVRARLTQELGLPPESGRGEFLQALADRVHDVSEASPVLESERARYDELSQVAEQRGIMHIVTAGNDGDFAAFLTREGVTTEPGFFRSVLANDHVTVVGATEGEKPAHFTSPDAGAEVSAPGVDVPVWVDGDLHRESGTSFAAPQVAALAARAREAHPNLSNAQMEGLLKLSAVPAGPEFLTGAGRVEEQRLASALAELY